MTRILLIEDLPSDADLATREISRSVKDTDFHRVETREDFLHELETFHPDLIVSDFKLPAFDGLSALRLAREHTPSTPFIILTGSQNEDTAVDCMKAGANDYVIKEHIVRLGPAVRGALEQKRLLTEKAATEAKLNEKTAELEAYFALSLNLLCIADMKGYFRRMNPAWEKALGYSLEELEGQRFLDFVHPEDVPGTLQTLQKLADQNQVYGFINRYRTKNGDYRWLDWRSHPAGSLIYAAAVDITDNIRLVEELRKFQLAVEGSGSSVMITDSDGVIEYVNKKFENVSDYTRKEVIGKKASILKSGRMEPGVYNTLWDTILRGEEWHGELENRTKDGRLFWERLSISSLSHDHGKIDHFVGIKEDITERKNLELQLAQAQKLEGIGRLAGGVAHDYNNILGIIIGFCELSLAHLEHDHAVYHNIESILKTANRGADLTRQLLAFARKEIIMPVPLNLNQSIQSIRKILGRLIGEDIELRIDLAQDLHLILIDPTQVDQILVNLATNARDAMQNVGTISIHTANISLTPEFCKAHAALTPGAYVHLAVSDTGHGIDEDILPRIFDPFFTTKAAGEGTGLGLSTVFGIVKQSDGHVEVSSEPGKGTRFDFYFPVYAGGAKSKMSTAPEKPLFGSETVLLVEDEKALLDIGRRGLQAYKYKVLIASSPDEAVLISDSYAGKIDLLVTDVVLPSMNGKELSDRISEKRPDLKTLFMSGYTADIIAKRGVLETGMHFIQKPFRPKDLAIKVRQVLDEPRT